MIRIFLEVNICGFESNPSPLSKFNRYLYWRYKKKRLCFYGIGLLKLTYNMETFALLFLLFYSLIFLIANIIDLFINLNSVSIWILISISIIQTLILFLANIFSLINIFSNKTSKVLNKILLLAVPFTILLVNINWLINNIRK